MSERKTVAFTTSFRLHPAFVNVPRMFARAFWVWALNPDGVVPVFGSVPSWPDTKTKGPATTAPEKGYVPGFGGSIRSIMVSRAASVRTRINVAPAGGAQIETSREVRRTPMDHHDHMTAGPDESQAHLGHEMHPATPAPMAMEHDHGSMMEQDFRRRFFVVLVLTIPVLVLSPTIQSWAGYRLPNLPASNLILAAFASVIALYGGLPFFRGAATSLRARTADMDVLVSLAILSGYLYSFGATFLFTASDFYWEISTLVLFLLFGHWMEMRSVSSASGALRELVKLIPPTANRVRNDGSIEEVATASLVVW